MEKKKCFFSKEQNRREFLIFTGKGICGAAVSFSILNFFDCKAGNTAIFPLAEGLLVADASRCTGCQRCEITCTAVNEGKIQPFISRITVGKNYNFGTEGPGVDFTHGDGQYGNLKMTPMTCRQCRDPFCKDACPVGAISADKTHRNAWTVDQEICIGCSDCVQACPWHLPNVDPETGKSSKCILCGACVAACPTGALSFIPWEEVKSAMDLHRLPFGS